MEETFEVTLKHEHSCGDGCAMTIGHLLGYLAARVEEHPELEDSSVLVLSTKHGFMPAMDVWFASFNDTDGNLVICDRYGYSDSNAEFGGE